MAVLDSFVQSDETPSACLAQHPDLRDLLEPMILCTAAPTGADAGNDVVDPWLFGKRYRVLRKMGSGAIGAVYHAFDEELRRDVAIKAMRWEIGAESSARQRFNREAEVMARLQHDHIVRIHAVGEHDGRPFLVMEFADAVPLSKLMKQLPARPDETEVATVSTVLRTLLRASGQARASDASDAAGEPTSIWHTSYVRQMVGWVVDIAGALHYAHCHGLVHRDVKPSNILIKRDGRAMLTDFGLARELGERDLTLTGEFAGTPAYASPEHFGSPAGIEPRSDVFSLGVTLYEMLTHDRPFHAASALDIRDRVERFDPRPASASNRHVPRDLGAVVARAMQKRKTDRYLNAAAFAADLQCWLDGFPVRARPIGTLRRLRRWVVRNKLASAFLLTLATSTGAVSWFWSAAKLQERQATAALAHAEVGDYLQRVTELWEAAGQPPVEPARRAEHWESLRARAAALCAQGAKFASRLQAHGQHVAPTLRLLLAERAAVNDLAATMWISLERASDYQRLFSEPLQDALTRMQGRQTELATLLTTDPAGPTDPGVERLANAVAAVAQLQERQLPRIARCAELARTLAQRSIVEHAAAWEETTRAIAADSVYEGLQLPPQPGLVPLGPDPESTLFEFAVLDTGAARARRDDSGRIVVGPDTGIVLVLLPPPDDVPGGAFFCSKFELTNGQLQFIADLLPLDAQGMPCWSLRQPLHPTMPAGWLNWYQSVAVLQHFGLELPTFAQWRWACHGGEDQRWATGDDEADVLATANFQRRYFWAVDRHNSGADGAFARPNAFGLFHLHGNISEWLADPMVSRTMPTGQVVVGLERGRAGGSLVDALSVSSCERCDFNEARYQNPNIGLRPVRRIGYESSQSTGPDK